MVARKGEEMKIHISDTTKQLLDKLGGFRCEYRGILDLGVRLLVHLIYLETFIILIVNF